MTGALMFKEAKPNVIRGLVEERVDPVLFRMSYHYVGDLAETTALIWPAPRGAAGAPARHNNPPRPTPHRGRARRWRHLEQERPAGADRAGWLDALDETGRWALLKLITRELRVGVSARLAKTAVAQLGGIERRRGRADLARARAALRRLSSPGSRAAGRSPNPAIPAPFRPPMLSHPLEDEDFAKLDAGRFPGRVEMGRHPPPGRRRAGPATGDRVRRIYSRTGEDVSRAFPDLVEALDFEGAIDGELLIVRDGRVQSFNVLQQRLNRKAVTPKLIAEFPGASARLRHPGRGRRGPARAALRRAPRAPRSPRRASRRPAHRPLADGALRDLGRARRRPGRPGLGRRRARTRRRSRAAC